MALIEDILQDLDEAVLDVGEKYFTSTADALDPMLTIVTTLLIVLIGVTMALGVNRMSMRDAWQLVSRIVLVFIFARSWTNFGVIYDALSSGAGSLALSFFQGDTPNPAAAMDQFAVQMSDVADGAARSFSSITRGVVAALLMMILSILMAAYILIVAFSKIMIAFLLGVAPLAMVATIFERTKTLFEAWLTAFVGYLMYPIAAAAVIGAVVSMAGAQFTEQDRIENFSMAIGFLCVERPRCRARSPASRRASPPAPVTANGRKRAPSGAGKCRASRSCRASALSAPAFSGLWRMQWRTASLTAGRFWKTS